MTCVAWNYRGGRHLIDFDDQAVALTFARQLAEDGREAIDVLETPDFEPAPEVRDRILERVQQRSRVREANGA